jgi:hypothetical protein
VKIYLICPVRRATDEDKAFLDNYIARIEARGDTVFYPARDNPYEETDRIGDMICSVNSLAIETADEVHIYWVESSAGSKFDLGIVFACCKPIVILNHIDETETKSFTKLLLHWPWGVKSYEDEIVIERLKALGYE